jgi:N-acetylneuraminate synthase/sialic acid synthase
MPRELVIGPNRIADDTDCYVIAEVGHNHQGELGKAMEMLRHAHECGAQAVKLQKRDNRTLFTRAMYDKPYDNENSFGPTYGAHREALEFGREEYTALRDYARELGITLFATAFDVPSADFLAELEMPAYKIASGDLKSIPLLKHIAGFGKPMILSTGGGTMEDVQRAYDAIVPINPQLCILQATATYPTQPEEMNLRVITMLREQFPEVVVGLSDHYNGISMAVAAFVLGARVVEKHFTLNHTWRGTDHALSLEPIGMSKMVRDLRRVRVGLGDGVKRPQPNEAPALAKMGKSLVASRDLPAGHVLSIDDIAMKSPGGGLPPYELERLVGCVLPSAVQEDDIFDPQLVASRPTTWAKARA